MSLKFFIASVVLPISVITMLTDSKNPMLTRITLNYPDSIVTGWAVTCKKSNDPNRTYYWYSNNQIYLTQGGHAGKLMHGEYMSRYPNGQLKLSGRFNCGLREGEWRQWFPNGNLKETVHYKNGFLHGKQTIYNVEQIQTMRRYKHGILKQKKKYQIIRADSLQPKNKSTKNKQVKKSGETIKNTKSDSLQRRVETDKGKKFESHNRNKKENASKDSINKRERRLFRLVHLFDFKPKN